MIEVIKLITASFFVGTTLLIAHWVDGYENIFPNCRKYSQERFFWICSQYKGKSCEKTKEYQIDNGCVYYDGQIMCGNFNIETAEKLHCEDWNPWFNRKKISPPKENK